MKSAKATSPFLLADVVFAAVVLALALSLGRQPPRAVVIDAATAPIAGQTAQAQSHSNTPRMRKQK